ncbi:MAG: sigma-70 family RNA polymerase sigma factor [Planctomycetia bacterium]|nr:sigma-70 family RNA polymerase sigma factor [Planctomycetia bacterium]
MDHDEVLNDADADALLIAALRAGEDSAFETLVRRYGGRMLSVARRLIGDDDHAQDALQDAFLSAFNALATFDGRSKISTWLHRIVVNAALMRLRSQKRHPEQSIDDLLPAFKADGHQEAPVARWKDSGESTSDRAEAQALVRQQIEKLPETYRTVLLLRDIEEHDTETVAQMLEISVAAVKVRLHRARQALRTLLDPVFGEQYS